MTRICTAGGNGQVGREVVRMALDGGHSVAVLSRHPPSAGSPGQLEGATYFRADVRTGAGLAAALAGADVVIDCLEGGSGKALKSFADGGARLLAAVREGLNLAPGERHGTETFECWLEMHADSL